MSIAAERILYEDEHLLAVNKLAAELTVRGKGQLQKLPLLDFLKKDYPGLRALHRLDFETSGVLLFGKTKAAQQAVLNTGFDGWKKTYQAIVAGVPRQGSGSLTAPLPARGEGKVPAKTNYKVVERFGIASLIEADIETGRHHQIRRHFAGIGHPLVLDDEYGDIRINRKYSRILKMQRFFLHASRLELPHPITGEKIIVQAPLPRAFEQALEKLRRGLS